MTSRSNSEVQPCGRHAGIDETARQGAMTGVGQWHVKSHYHYLRCSSGRRGNLLCSGAGC